jgi:hypothetical protein
MRKKSRNPRSRKNILRLPDLDHTNAAVLNSLSSLIPDETISSRWSSSLPGTAPNRAVL